MPVIGLHSEIQPGDATRGRLLRASVTARNTAGYIIMDNSVVAANKDASQENINNDQTKVQLQELKLFWENFLQCSNDNVKVYLLMNNIHFGILIHSIISF